VSKDMVIGALGNDNIECRPLWKPMHLQPVFKRSPSYLNGTADDLFQRGMCIPSGSNLSNDDLDRVVEGVKKCFD